MQKENLILVVISSADAVALNLYMSRYFLSNLEDQVFSTREISENLTLRNIQKIC